MTPHHVSQQVPQSLRRRSVRMLLAAVAVMTLLLAGCSTGQDTSDEGAAPVAGGGAPADYGADKAEQDAASIADQQAPSDLTGSQEYRVREAAIGLKVDDIAQAAAQVRRIAAEADGSVVNESFGDDYYGPARTTIDRYGSITIAVPSERLDATMEALSQLGEVRTRSSNSQDVEAEFVDVEARIATLEASIERMRDLMTQTNDIDQIVKLETALSSRQADLDALQARLNSLSARIAMSPVTVMLTTTDDLGEPNGGFIGALEDAWEAMKTSAGILVTAAGALLPWVIVGGLGVWALVWAIRRNERRRQAKATAASRTQPQSATDVTPPATEANAEARTPPGD